MKQRKLEQIINNWGKTGLLNAVYDADGDGEALALCLQTQVDFNETHELNPQFRRISIPALVHIFMMSEAIKRNRFVNYFEEVIWPNVLIFKTKMIPPKPSEEEHYNLNIEANWLAEACGKWAKELDAHFRGMRDREIIFRGLGHLDDGTVLMHYS